MKKDRLYNIIFPLWMAMFFPPYIFLTLTLNLIIDGTVIYSVLLFNKVKPGYKKLSALIAKAWGFGFLADFIGAVLLLLIEEKMFNLEVYNIWNDPASIVIYTCVVLAVGSLIYMFNFRLFRKNGFDKKVSLKVALAMGIITAPWSFMLPLKWFS